jgi:hypothetical protein
MYRKHEAAERAAMLQQLVKQLDVLEALTRGPFIAGATMTAADSALLPTFVFLTFILPRFFGWADVFAGRPQLRAWWAAMQQDPCSQRVSAGRVCVSVAGLLAAAGDEQCGGHAWVAAREYTATEISDTRACLACFACCLHR